MPDAPAPRIFISYARSDRDFAITLRDGVLAAGLTVWHDLQDLEAGQWWSQIANAIESKAIEHIVLIASPDAQASRIVAQECWFAQREGKTASLVLPPQHDGKIDFKKLPRFMQAAHHYNLAEPDQKARFIERLREPGQGPRRPRPEGRPKPPDYVARDKEYGQMRAALLDAGGEATTATVVLTGHGGFGKTTLATALVNDEAVQQAYFNGILLVELGEALVLLPKTYDGRKTLEGLIRAKVEALIRTLEDKDERFDTLEAAKARLKEILDKRHGAVLLWIEDAWDVGHARHFIDAAPNAAKLVTSRIRDILPEAATHIDVDELTDAEAAAFMARGLDPKTDIERSGLRALATMTAGRWPILIRQINAQLKYQTTPQSRRKAQALGEAISSLQTRLKREGLDDLDKSTDTNRATAVRLSVGVSFDMLREEDRHRKFQEGFHEARYLDLAGFQEAEVPIATIARLWGHLGVLRRTEAPTLDVRDEARRAEQEGHWYAALRKESIDVLERLYALALLQKLDAGDDDGMVRLHDVMRQYLADKQKDALQAFHSQFVLAYDAESREAVTDMTERERLYFYKWFPTHLHEAGKNERDDNGHRPLQQALDALLLTPNWMARKLHTCGALPLLQDYQAYSRLNLHAYVGRSIGMALDAISRMPEQLGPQLVARLAADDAPEAADFLEAARQIFPAAYLSVAWPTFTAPGDEVCRIQAHKAKITGLLPLDGSRFVCWASHWNYRQSPHLTEPLAQVCDLTSGRAVHAIGRKDEVIHCITRLTATEIICVSSPSQDMSFAETHEHRIRRWDCTIPAIKNQTLFTSTPVRHVASLGSDRFITKDSKGKLTLFNASDLAPIPREGPPWEYSYALTAVDAQRLIGTTEYRDPCRLWDVESGREVSRFELLGPEDDDEPFWRAAQRAEHAVAARSTRHPTVTGSHYYARELSVADGALFVENGEDMIYVWDIATAKLQFAVDLSNVFAVPEPDDLLKRPRFDAVRPERRRIECVVPVSAREAFVCTRDNKIRKIDLAEQKVLWESVVAPDSWRLAHAISPEQILFTADENTVVLVDTRLSGPRRQSLWHNDQVIEVRVADAQTAMSCGKDQTVRAWDMASGAAKFPAVKCPAEINAILPLDADRVICACRDGKSRLFDLQSSELVNEFEGHKGSVRSLVALDNTLFVTATDDGEIALWSCEEGTPLKIERLPGGRRGPKISHLRSVAGVCVIAHLERGVELGVGDITPEHIASMDEVVLIELPEMNIVSKHRFPMFHTDFVSGPYGNMFLSVGRQHQGRQKVFLWELGSERPRGALSLAGDDVQAVALTQNGLAVATHDDKTIRLHKPSTGAVLASVTNDVAFTSFEMMPDEQSLVAGDAAGRVHWIQLGGQL